MTRVLIVEDNPGFRQALAVGLRAAGYQVAASCAGGDEALDCLDATAVDVALVDLGLPGMSGADTIRALRRRVPTLPALVLTVFEDRGAILEAIEAGARGYLLKGGPLTEVTRAIDEVKSGLSPLSSAAARHVFDHVQRREPRDGACPLTDRERDVLNLLVRGHAYADVARALDIGVGTVQSHVKRLYKKLEVSTKAEAACVALREGWVRE